MSGERIFGQRFRVRIRRDREWEVRPGAESIDGRAFNFYRGWEIEEGIYQGEMAWIPRDPDYPSIAAGAPPWISSGDLVPVDNDDGARHD